MRQATNEITRDYVEGLLIESRMQGEVSSTDRSPSGLNCLHTQQHVLHSAASALNCLCTQQHMPHAAAPSSLNCRCTQQPPANSAPLCAQPSARDQLAHEHVLQGKLGLNRATHLVQSARRVTEVPRPTGDPCSKPVSLCIYVAQSVPVVPRSCCHR